MNLLTLWPYTNFEHFGIIRFWVIIIIIIIKNEKIRVTLCENAAGALYIVNNAADKQTDRKQTNRQTDGLENPTHADEWHFISDYNRASFAFARWRYWRGIRRGFELYEYIL